MIYAKSEMERGKMKGVLVDFWPDTIDNLEELSKTEEIPKNELIRRGAESVLVLYGVSKSEVGEILLKDLKESARILSNKPVNKTNLVRALSEATALSSALSAIYVVNEGKEQAGIIRIYFRTLQEHLLVISEPGYIAQKEDFETIKEDVSSFANVLAKLSEVKSAYALGSSTYMNADNKDTIIQKQARSTGELRVKNESLH